MPVERAPGIPDFISARCDVPSGSNSADRREGVARSKLKNAFGL